MRFVVWPFQQATILHHVERRFVLPRSIAFRLNSVVAGTGASALADSDFAGAGAVAGAGDGVTHAAPVAAAMRY